MTALSPACLAGSACTVLLCLLLLASRLSPAWLFWQNNWTVAVCGLGLGAAFARSPRLALAASAALGFAVSLCVFQPYTSPAQSLDILALCATLGLLWRNLCEQGDACAVGGERVDRTFLGLFAVVICASLALLPLGDILRNGLALGFLPFSSWLAGSTPKDLIYPLASASRLVIAVLLAWQWARFARQPDRQRALWLGLGVGACAGALYEIGYKAELWRLFLWPQGAARHPSRWSGAMGHPTWFGMFMVVLTPGVLLIPWRKKRVAWLAGLGLLVCLFVLLMSQARSAWLIMCLQLLVMASVYDLFRGQLPKRWLKVGGLAVLVLGGLYGVYASQGAGKLEPLKPETTPLSVRLIDFKSERYAHWRDALAFTRLSPWLGLGYDSFRQSMEFVESNNLTGALPAYSGSDELVDDPHQWYLHLLFGAGPFALGLWLAFVWQRLRAQWRALRAPDGAQARSLALALFLASAGCAVYGLFQNLHYPPAFFLVMLLFLCCPVHPAKIEAASTRTWSPVHLVALVLAAAYLTATLCAPNIGMLSERLGQSIWTTIMGEPKAVGVYPLEKWPQGPVRWTGKTAGFDLPAGPHQMTIFVQRPDLGGSPVLMQVDIPGQGVREFSVGQGSGEISLELAITPQPGCDTARLGLSLSRVFVPRLFGPGPDGRYLGAAVLFRPLPAPTP